MAEKKAAAPSFDFDLVVIHQFGFNTRGTRITDPQEIAAILDSENERHCHKVAKEDPQ
ncbi:hypothetical protein KTE60_11640 [Burkholderia multivorans]|uniref:hypothetical protein n=1 Tax=Burkholderia multivorans TaxID=87883 RepID=UPI001C210161|nr:hypothetical protein [Burkholderia multivorans]MBU9629937.1 hypothetical protein [Burkholderia multivorans]MDN8027915.1 hypothetical protein [Burkholderia multivorans]HEF4742806.1 hypothetical protein [Burkholderia multivorans]